MLRRSVGSLAAAGARPFASLLACGGPRCPCGGRCQGRCLSAVVRGLGTLASGVRGAVGEIAVGRPVIGDGGGIFELEKRGYLEEVPRAVEFPVVVRLLHTEFNRAGADVVPTLTLCALEGQLKSHANEAASLFGRLGQMPIYITTQEERQIKEMLVAQCKVCAGSGMIGLTCHFGPNETAEAVYQVNLGAESPGLDVTRDLLLTLQPLTYYTPDASKQGFVDLPGFWGSMPPNQQPSERSRPSGKEGHQYHSFGAAFPRWRAFESIKARANSLFTRADRLLWG